MTQVFYSRSNAGFTLVCKGHADYAQRGKDIVCAGISALCGALEISLDNLQDKGMAVSHFCRTDDGYFYAAAQAAEMSIGVETAFELVYDGLCRIEEAYPQNLSCRRRIFREEESE